MKLRIQVEGRLYDVDVDFPDRELKSNGKGHAAEIAIPKAVLRPRPPHRLPEDDVCRSPIAGKIVAVMGASGNRVRRNEAVLLIEAMKMEIPIGPAVDGTVGAIHVQAGDSVKVGQALFDLD
jgi:biotin carboxyl carrier protein